MDYAGKGNRMLSIWLALAIHASTDPAPGVRGRSAEPQITLTLRARSLKSALEELSKVSGTKLEVSANMEWEPLLLKVKDVPFATLLEKIAEATFAEWEKTPDGYRLRRSPELVAKQNIEELEARTRAWKEVLDRLRAGIENEGEYTAANAQAAWARVEATEARLRTGERSFEPGSEIQIMLVTPVGRLAKRIAASIDPAVIAAAPLDERVVLAVRPNRAQRPLGRSIEPAIRAFEAEMRIWIEATPRGARETSPFGNEALRFLWALEGQQTPELGKVLVVVTHRLGMTPWFEVIVADKAGDYIARHRVHLESPPVSQEAVRPEDKSPLTLSPLLQEAADRARQMFGPGDPKPAGAPSDEFKSLILRPDQNDPNRLVDELLFDWADLYGANLVSSPPDVSLFFLMPVNRETLTPSILRAKLRSRFDTASIVESPGWLVVRPPGGRMGVQMRLNRTALARFAPDVVVPEGATIDALARYAASPGMTEFGFQFGVAWLSLLHPSLGEANQTGQFLVYRLHGTLPTEARRRLLEGAEIPISALDPSTRETLRLLVFDSTSGMSLSAPQNNTEARNRSPWSHLSAEITEICPNGLPANGTLMLTASSQEIVIGKGLSAAGHPATYVMSPDSMASDRLSRIDPARFQNFGTQATFETFQYGAEENWSYRIRLTEEATKFASIRNRRMDERVYSKYEDLPASFREKVDAIVKRRLDIPPGS